MSTIAAVAAPYLHRHDAGSGSTTVAAHHHLALIK